MKSAMIWQTVSTGPGDTERLGELLGSQLKGGEIIELRSDLGGGKTTFVRGLVRGAGSQAAVTSPTFTLSRIYKVKNLEIHHFDFYRLDDPGILTGQLAESINDINTVTIIEWADIVKNVLPDNHLSIEIRPSANDPEERQIKISYLENQSNLIRNIETNWQETEP